MKNRLGSPPAITATAHKIARLVYFTLRLGRAYVDQGADWYNNQFQARSISPRD